ncbi:predicted protein [Postia placenta Mad-698-R]|nr:predicted protein [Postia placenta Mad-698-R]
MSGPVLAAFRSHSIPAGLQGTLASSSCIGRSAALRRTQLHARCAGRAVRDLHTRNYQTEVFSERVGVEPALIVPKSKVGRPPEPSQVVTRPFGLQERYFVSVRGYRGCADPFTIAAISTEDLPPIRTEQIVLTWAALRVRHPLLAARVQTTPAGPSFVYLPPLTKAHALIESRMHLEFRDADDRQAAIDALEARWRGVALVDAIDPRHKLYSAVWIRSPSGSGTGSQYAMGFQSTHFTVDGLGMFDVVGEFMELLANPGRAEAELDEYFADPNPTLPEPCERLLPEPEASSKEEKCKGRQAYKELMAGGEGELINGIFPDGTLKGNEIEAYSARHSWSTEETRAIVDACKKHHVTVTQFVASVMVIATIQELQRVGRPVPQGGVMKIHVPIDLWSRARSDKRGVAVRMSHYPIFVHAPSTNLLDTKHGDLEDAILEVARQYKDGHANVVDSQHFWHLIRHYLVDCQKAIDALARSPSDLDAIPFLPLFSSTGNLNKLIPSSLPAVAPVSKGADVVAHAQSRGSGKIHVQDLTINQKCNPAIVIAHLWTFNGRLNYNFTYNRRWASAGVMDPYIKRMIDMISSFAQRKL